LYAYDNEKFVKLNSIHCLQLFTDELNYNYILTIINSNLCNWIFRHENFHMVRKPLAGVKVIFVERLPIIKIRSELQKTFNEKALFRESINASGIAGETTRLKTNANNQHKISLYLIINFPAKFPESPDL